MNYWTRKNIKLRAFEDKDLEKYVSERNNPDCVRQLYEDYIEFPLSELEVRKSIDSYISTFKEGDKRLFVIEEISSEEYAGEVSVWDANRRNGVFKYGIFLDEKFRGKGYAADALIIVMDYYFNELNYQKCAPTVYSSNALSQHFHEKLGFIKEGELRNDVYNRGKYHNMICYGMLKNEFAKLYKHEFH
jgi:RimJ/RimL family protein N-acetyltransferase